MPELIPESVLCTAEELQRVLADGGRAEVTVRSRKSGAHVKLTLACKRRRPQGEKGYLPRNIAEGRVGLADAHKIDILDPDLEWPESKVGAFSLQSRRYFNDGGDRARAWTAEAVCRWMLGAGSSLEGQAEVLLSTRCCVCGRRLTDPISVSRMIGPECAGKRTGSRAAPRTPQRETI